MSIPPKLTIAPYLQRWDANSSILYFNILVMPTGNPLSPLGKGLPVVDKGPNFADCNLEFDVHFSKNWQQMPGYSEIDATSSLSPTMPSDRIALFEELKKQFKITKSEATPVRKANLMVRKHLTPSYTTSFGFVKPKTSLASTDDTYTCLLNCPPKKKPIQQPIDNSVSWAEAMSFTLRQPILAKSLGIIYELEIKLDPKDIYDSGGWLFVSLSSASDYHHLLTTPNFIKVFASRVPALKMGVDRPLFTPVLFPVVDDPAVTTLPGNFDEAFLEANRYNDGFAKIVHCHQTVNQDRSVQEENGGPAPIYDEGLELAWDDEDILIAQNRQMGLEPDTMNVPAEAPMGVVGYRIDVREQGETDWNSLSDVNADNFEFGGVNFGSVSWESRTEVFPSTVQEQFWLPPFFTRWKGGSLVVKDDDHLLIMSGVKRSSPLYYKSQNAFQVPLKYGNQYEFRVRMVDTTNGGPQLNETMQLSGEAPICKATYKRHIPPGPVTWSEEEINPYDAVLTSYTITRPRIELPQALYTGFPNVRTHLLNIVKGNDGLSAANSIRPSIPDVDATTLGIRVLVRTPDFDPAPIERDEEGYVEWYTTTRIFPNDIDTSYLLNLEYVDANRLEDIDLSLQMIANPVGDLLIPSARDIKIELQAIGKNDLDYFGSEKARKGEKSFIFLHKKATSEVDFLKPQSPQDIIRSIYLQPTDVEQEMQINAKVIQNVSLPILVQRLAGATGLVANDTTLMMPPGERGVFGCSSGLKHYLPANNSSLIFMAIDELSGQWINTLKWKINRDWTWKGYGTPTFNLTRKIELNGDAYMHNEHIGEVRMMHAVTPLIEQEIESERDSFSFVFVDAFQAPIGADGNPYEVNVEYELEVSFENGETLKTVIENNLPITIKPKQIPKVVSAGIALSPYITGENYSSTEARQRMLWIEFEEPPKDKRDSYFVRVLAQTADPMLLQHYQPLENPAGYKQWSLDPETIRMISPGQGDDFAGLTAMQRLIPAHDSDRHFLVPLPPGTYPDSPELFGFYTYEFRVGHDKGSPANPFWSTAQARFGPASILEGVQHPCPPLKCNLHRVKNGLLASSAYATPFHEGTAIQANPPNSEIWYVLYAQVHQADGKQMRNIELDKRLGRILNRKETSYLKKLAGIKLSANVSDFQDEDIQKNNNSFLSPLQAHGFWQQEEVYDLLKDLGLSSDTPLSILGLELLPEPTGSFPDPIGGNLGEVRILRTSPLYDVDHLCC
ncbi:MAG: hypothetical protein P1U56_26500 [Saprospiraceae bacterium]|nr:hypothetical protein [Saprospiraceae bacterium]